MPTANHYTVKEVAALFGRTTTTVRRMIHAGLLPGVEPTRRGYLIPRAVVDAVLRGEAPLVRPVGRPAPDTPKPRAHWWCEVVKR